MTSNETSYDGCKGCSQNMFLLGALGDKVTTCIIRHLQDIKKNFILIIVHVNYV